VWQSAHLRQPACHSRSGATRRMYWSWIWEPQPTHMDIRRFCWRSCSLIPKEATQDTLGDINQNGITNWATLPADEPNTSKFRSLWRDYAIGASCSYNATWSALSLSGSLLAGGSTTNFTNWYPVVNATLVIGRPPFITCQTLRVFLDLKQR